MISPRMQPVETGILQNRFPGDIWSQTPRVSNENSRDKEKGRRNRGCGGRKLVIVINEILM